MIAYGELRLLPDTFMALTIDEFERMVECYNERHEQQLWEIGYWVVNIMNTNLTKPMSLEKLVKPILPAKDSRTKAAEKAAFFADFERQRKESEKNGSS